MKRLAQLSGVDWDAGDEDYLREQIRTNPLVKDPGAIPSRAPRFEFSAAEA